MAYNGFGSGVVAKYQELEMEVAFRTGLAPRTVGYVLTGVAAVLVVALVVAGVSVIN